MKIGFSKEQINDRLAFENPWWKEGKIESYYGSMKKRAYFDILFPLIQESEIKRAVVIMGPRRVGKTVLMYHAIQQLIDTGVPPTSICFFSVETPIYNGISLEELFRIFLDKNQKKHTDSIYVFFDEIQYLKNWEVHLKSLVDSYHAVKFIVSGSAAAALKLKSDESGAGRFTDFILPPLTFHEYLSLKNLETLVTVTIENPTGNRLNERKLFHCDDIASLNKHFIDYINFGGYPEVSLSKSIQADPGRYIRNDIVDKVLLRDLPLLYGIDDIQELNSLFTYIAYHTGSEMSLDSISTSSGVSKNTIKKYITYLEAAFLIRVIRRVDSNGKKFKRDNFFKIYLTNPSLRCALFSPIAEDDEIAGHLVETAIFSQWQHISHTLYYGRWSQGEIDIVNLSSDQPGWCVEIKWTNKPAEDYSLLKNVKFFCSLHHLNNPTVTTYDISKVAIIDGVEYTFIPSALYCYQVGKNLIDWSLRKSKKTVEVVK
jgi:predicted AAA+ superfamily ATPase